MTPFEALKTLCPNINTGIVNTMLLFEEGGTEGWGKGRGSEGHKEEGVAQKR